MLVESHASATTIQAQPAPGSCHATGSGPFALPDRHCTPGALNPAVDPADIRSTICVPGYSESVRPPEAVTEPEKYASLAAYGDPSDPGGYEYDHLVPLELGGAPNDPRNLWPEPGASPNPKDSLEDRLHEMVCAGDISLTVAQHEIATDWVAAYRRDVGPIRPTAPVRPTGGGGAWCHASAKPANDGYPGDYEVTVTSDQPDAKALASDAGDRWYQYTDALGGAEIRLYRTTTGEQIIVTVGAVTCTTRA